MNNCYLFIYESQNSRKINEALKTEQNKTWKSFFFRFVFWIYHDIRIITVWAVLFQKIMLLIIFSSYTDQGTWKHNLLFAPCKGIRKVLLVEWGILGFGIWNAAQGIRNPTNDWKPECKFQYLKSTACKYCLTSPHMKRFMFSCSWPNSISAQSAKHHWGRLTSLIDSIPIIFCFVSVQLYNYSWIQNKVRTKHFLESISRHYRVFSMSLNENNNNKKNFETIKRKKPRKWNVPEDS